MSFAFAVFEEKSRLKSLLDHFAMIEDPREAWRVAHPLAEVLLLVVCATMADCDDYEAIAAWGAAHLEFLRRYRPFYHGVPGGPLAYAIDEPDQSGAVFRRLQRVGARNLA